MRTLESGSRTRSQKRQLGRVFRRWVRDRNILVTVFLLSFLVWDSLLTYLGLFYLGVGERNIVVSTILRLENGWYIWLGLKVLIALVGTALFFMVYYMVSTSPLPKEKREGVLLLEFCGWIYLISFNLLSVFMWSGVVLEKMVI
ncbi:MAG: hypothetical protein ACE5KV_01710 [Thermoplasmata archaeon]